MKNKLKREYEVFNLETGEWESKNMTDEEYLELQHKMDVSAEQIDAEYQVITRIISQQMGLSNVAKESMD
jgi:hypothetical protein|tara:strand:- start:3096 stop:3305 length:210 start_codon:yes stop_codon:yes gene_type:complete